MAKIVVALLLDMRRGYDAAMADVIHPITDADILDLSYFLARVR